MQIVCLVWSEVCLEGVSVSSLSSLFTVFLFVKVRFFSAPSVVTLGFFDLLKAVIESSFVQGLYYGSFHCRMQLV